MVVSGRGARTGKYVAENTRPNPMPARNSYPMIFPTGVCTPASPISTSAGIASAHPAQSCGRYRPVLETLMPATIDAGAVENASGRSTVPDFSGENPLQAWK